MRDEGAEHESSQGRWREGAERSAGGQEGRIENENGKTVQGERGGAAGGDEGNEGNER